MVVKGAVNRLIKPIDTRLTAFI